MSDVTSRKAALERGTGIVLVTPPAPEQAPVWDLVESARAVIICADQTAALDWVAAAPPGRTLHAVTGLARTARLLKANAPDILVAAVPDLAALVSQSALKLAAFPFIILAWPEGMVGSDTARLLDELLAEAPDARRIVLSWDPNQLGGFLERHAHRAPVFGELPLDPDGRRAPPEGAAQFAIVTPERRLSVLRDLLDALDPPNVVIWTPDERHAERLRATAGIAPASVVTDVPREKAALIVAARVPARRTFAQLAQAGPVVLLAAPYQMPYLRTIAAPLQHAPLAPAANKARERTAALHDRIAGRLERADVDAELLQLAPLFERFDPAEVAAALLSLAREEPASVGTSSPAVEAGAPAAWVKVFVGVGRRDGAAPKDLVGAMTRELGVAKTDIGRVEVRDTFSLVEVAPQLSAALIKGLGRVTIRGRRVTAKLDQRG